MQDNTKLVGSLFLGGVWLLLLTWIFPAPFGSWLEDFVLAGWVLIGIASFLFLRRKFGKSPGRGIARKPNSLFPS
ncbi:MAG TPA: hypothetical protein VJN93_08520 [Candidatus Acidoferrum sp.]|nr:hypothetical protein [Candidatus Acidoferrum sp.]